MWKKIAIGGAIAAATLGAGTAALAASGSTTSGSPAPASPSASKPAGGKHPALRAALGRDALHGQWVTGKVGSTTFTTHDAIRGVVTTVSPTSITVKAVDNVSQTYVVNSDTKVRMRSAGKGAASSIGAVKTGDHVLVAGTGTSTLTANGVIDVK